MDTFLTIADVTWNWLVSLAHLLQLDVLCNRNSPKWVQSDLRPNLPLLAGVRGSFISGPRLFDARNCKSCGTKWRQTCRNLCCHTWKTWKKLWKLGSEESCWARHFRWVLMFCVASQPAMAQARLSSQRLYETFQDISILQETCAVDVTPFSLKQMEEPSAKVSLWPIAKAQNISEPCWFAESQSWWALSDDPWNSDLWLHKFSGISTALKQTLGVGALSSKDTLDMKNLAEMRSKKKVSDEIVKVMNTLYYLLNG